jgi:hypothetical protein
MFGNSRSLSFAGSSSGGSVNPSYPLMADSSEGALTLNQLILPSPARSLGLMLPSAGSLISQYGKGLVATASTHTILHSLFVPILVQENSAPSAQPVASSIPQVAEAMFEIAALTGLSKARIAENVFCVSRTAYYDWESGKQVSLENERRIRETLDVLRHAARRYGSPELVRGWLVTPTGSRAQSPLELLGAGKLNEARMLALSDLPERRTPLPEWLLNGQINEWAEREQKRRDLVVLESDSIQ